ncbi:MAG TPA: TIGR04290 family methyltransferase [Ramlibacter sp.]|jgi:tRNA (mo5U34)-methyltransferase|uniref:TIGR04290 family methyltransferase n=1 Tax=Ramlibacter sp. TaxID=1917967 RepID=UPI002D6620DF|nr:TIGR04290 family methyltransferase [Ramlibacter sp.]HZY17902.1 TIGR04290 family methyltransferase [Ramlibacter sp.]
MDMQGHDEAVDTEALRREIESLGPWFHNLHLPGGVETVPNHFLGGDFPRFKWLEIAPHLPEDLSGWRVLDVGCNAGFYSFELARRGASVLAIDVEELYLAQARWAARVYGLEQQVEFRHMGVYEVARLEESFDLVWFMGVFYHLRYPMLALDVLARKTRRRLVFQTLTMPGETVYPDTADHPITEREPLLDPGWPKMAFIEHKFAGDPSNWWVPNHAGCEAMLRASGLRITGRPAGEIYLCEPDPDSNARFWMSHGVVDPALDALQVIAR